MKHLVVVAGGDSERRLALKSKLDLSQYNVRICNYYEEFTAASKDPKLTSIMLLYQDESETVAKLYDYKFIEDFFGKLPVVFISSTQSDNTTARSLNYRADDFLIEPVSSDELSSIIAHAGRLSIKNEDLRLLTIGDIVLDRLSLTVTVRDIKLHLCPIPIRILEILMLSPGRAK